MIHFGHWALLMIIDYGHRDPEKELILNAMVLCALCPLYPSSCDMEFDIHHHLTREPQLDF